MGIKKENLTESISGVISQFLGTQLSEFPSHIKTFINDDVLVIYAYDIISPAEQTMMSLQPDQKILMDYKKKQFESIKDEFSKQIRGIIESDIIQFHSSITEDGTRIINIHLEKMK